MNSKLINKKGLIIADSVMFIIILMLDRASKYFINIKIKGHPSLPLLPGFLELNYLENYGAAFGMLKNQKYFFVMITGILLLTIIYIIFKSPSKSKYIGLHTALVFIGTGALSNTCDRLFYGYVVDFIYLYEITFPTFNIADIFITIGTVLLIILMIFVFKEDDLNFLRFKEKRLRDIN